MASIKIPTPLRAYTGGNAVVEVSGDTVEVVLNDLLTKHPDLKQHIYNEGKLRSFVNIFIGQDNVRDLNGMETEVADDAKLRIIPSIAGGNHV
ncbi:MAG: MoaD/ThiS family protein [Aggregatilineales bacterium]